MSNVLSIFIPFFGKPSKSFDYSKCPLFENPFLLYSSFPYFIRFSSLIRDFSFISLVGSFVRFLVFRYFDSYSMTDFARGGNVSPMTVIIDEGPLRQFSHALEPQLRSLGLPTVLKRGSLTEFFIF